MVVAYTNGGKSNLTLWVSFAPREQKIVFFDRYITEKLVFGRHREEKAKEKSIRGKIGKKLVKSPIFHQKIGKYRFFHRKVAIVELACLC